VLRGAAPVEASQNAWNCVHQARNQHFLHVFSSVPTAARTQPQLILQLRPLLLRQLQRLHRLRPHLGSALTTTQAQVIAATTVAIARTPVAGPASCAEARRLVTTVHQTAQVKVKTWPLLAWIGPSEAMQ